MLGIDDAIAEGLKIANKFIPDGSEKARFESEYRLAMLAADTTAVQAVNATMQAESKSEHWAQWLWRPFNGFAFGITLFCNYAIPVIVNSLILPFLSSPHTPLVAGTIPPEALMAWGAILGVTAWHRGAMQVEQAKR